MSLGGPVPVFRVIKGKEKKKTDYIFIRQHGCCSSLYKTVYHKTRKCVCVCYLSNPFATSMM